MALKWLKGYGLPVRNLSEAQFKLKISKVKLEDLYLNQKLSTNKIAKMFNLSDPERVRNLLIYYGILRRDSIEVRSIIVNLEPSNELAYVLGVMEGDGSITAKCTAKLGSIDKVFVDEFGKKLKKLGFNVAYSFLEKSKLNPKWHDIFFAGGSSTQFCKWYKSLSLEDIEKLLITKKMELEFVRGFYESEGHHSWKGYISIANSEKSLLESTQKILSKFSINSKINGPYSDKRHPHWKAMYALRINSVNAFHFFCTISAIIKFKKEIWEDSGKKVIFKKFQDCFDGLAFSKNHELKFVSKQEMFFLISKHAPVFESNIEGKMKDNIVPFASSNRPFIVYVCLDSLRDLTKSLTVEERNLFIEGCLIHEIYHGKINDEFSGTKQEEEQWIIEETKKLFPESRKIVEKALYGKTI